MENGKTEKRRGGHIRVSLGILYQVLVAFLFTVSVAVIIGGVVYGLFRMAVLDKRIYAYLYLLVVVVLFLYLLYRLIRKRRIGRVLLRLAWGALVFCLIGAFLSMAVLYGSLFVRFPLAAYISAPVIVFCLVYFLPRLKLLKRLKAILS